MPEELDEPNLIREPLDPSVQLWAGSKPDDAFRIERVCYQTMPGVRVPAYLLIPSDLTGPAPAVLCPPGHGGGMNQVLFEDGIYKQYPR